MKLQKHQGWKFDKRNSKFRKTFDKIAAKKLNGGKVSCFFKKFYEKLNLDMSLIYLDKVTSA